MLPRALRHLYAVASLLFAIGLSWSVATAQTLTWTDADTGLTGFEIWRAPVTTAPVGCGQFSKINQVAGTVFTYKDTDPLIKPGTAWCYQVKAFNATMQSPMSNTANYTKPLSAPTLTVTVAAIGGGASGTVASSPDGILCTSDRTCSATFPAGSTVALGAVPKANGTKFTRWTGACSGADPSCTVPLTADQTVGAEFTK